MSDIEERVMDESPEIVSPEQIPRKRRVTDALVALLVVRNIVLTTGVLWCMVGLYFLVLVTVRTLNANAGQPPRAVQLLSTYGFVLAFLLGGVSFFLIALSTKLWKT